MSQSAIAHRTAMTSRWGLVLILGGLASTIGFRTARADDSPGPKIRVSEATTRVTEPLDEQGYVDYVAALNAKFGEGVTPAENAAVGLEYVLGPELEGVTDEWRERRWQLLGIAPLPEQGGYFVAFDAFAQSRGVDFEQVDQIYDATLETPWADADQPLAAEWLDAVADPLKKAREAVRRPKYFSPVTAPNGESLVEILLPNVQEYRSIARAFAARANRRIQQGDLTGAADDIVSTHLLGRQCGQGMVVIELLVGYACSAIADTPTRHWLAAPGVTAEMIADLRAKLATLPPFATAADRIDEAERLMLLDVIQRMAQGKTSFRDLSSVAGMGAGNASQVDWESALSRLAFSGTDWNQVMVTANVTYDDYIAAARLEDRAARNERLAELNEQLQQKARASQNPLRLLSAVINLTGDREQLLSDTLSFLLSPAVIAMLQAEDRMQTKLVVMDTAMAIREFQLSEGRLPVALSELAPGQVASIPTDIFNGNAPLNYRVTETGFEVYSYGVNEKDDAGLTYGDAANADDIVVKVVLP